MTTKDPTHLDVRLRVAEESLHKVDEHVRELDSPAGVGRERGGGEKVDPELDNGTHRLNQHFEALKWYSIVHKNEQLDVPQR